MASDSKRRKSPASEPWDTEEGMLHSPVEKPGAVVTVRFTREEFQRVSRAARRAGMRTTQFVHAAALANLDEQLPVDIAEPAGAS
jgi:hypothetical protein